MEIRTLVVPVSPSRMVDHEWEYLSGISVKSEIANLSSMADEHIVTFGVTSSAKDIAHIPFFSEEKNISGEVVLVVGETVVDDKNTFVVTLTFMQIELSSAKPTTVQMLRYNLIDSTDRERVSECTARVVAMNAVGGLFVHFMLVLMVNGYAEMHFGKIDCEKGSISIQKALVCDVPMSKVRLGYFDDGDSVRFIVKTKHDEETLYLAFDKKGGEMVPIIDELVQEEVGHNAVSVGNEVRMIAWCASKQDVAFKQAILAYMNLHAIISLDGIMCVMRGFDLSRSVYLTHYRCEAVISACLGRRLVTIHYDGTARITNIERIASGFAGTLWRNKVFLMSLVILFFLSLTVYNQLNSFL